MSNSIEMRPCPFCGGKVKPPIASSCGHANVSFIVECNCGCTYDGGSTEETAIRTWNRRAISLPAPRQSLESFMLKQDNDEACFEGPYGSAHKNVALFYWGAALAKVKELN